MKLMTLLLLCAALASCTSQEGARVESEAPDPLPLEDLETWQFELLKRVEVLSADSLEGREFGSRGGRLAREYLVEEFYRTGLARFGDERTQSFTHHSKTGANIIGEIRSESLTDSAKVILIGAHYDHEGIKGGKVFNGADDNASGTSLLLSIADTLSKSALNDIRFVFVAFDAEEQGLVGAQKFIERNPDFVEQIDLMINFDMVSISESEKLYAAGTSHYQELMPIVESLMDNAEYTLKLGHDRAGTAQQDWTFSSDHGPFHTAQVPFLYFGVEDHEHYHQASDEYGVVDKDFYIRVASSFRHLLPQLESLL